MKTKLLIALVTFILCSCQPIPGQASFLFRTRDLEYGIDAPVFDAEGVPLSGPNYLAELWGAPSPDALAPFRNLGFGRTIVSFSSVSPGYLSSISETPYLLTVPIYGFAWLQMRAWDSRLGATYEEVAALGMGGYGESPLFYAQGGDPFDQFPTPGRLIGLQSFSLHPVPEPSTWALLALGGMSCLIWRWRCRRSVARPYEP